MWMEMIYLKMWLTYSILLWYAVCLHRRSFWVILWLASQSRQSWLTSSFYYIFFLFIFYIILHYILPVCCQIVESFFFIFNFLLIFFIRCSIIIQLIYWLIVLVFGFKVQWANLIGVRGFGSKRRYQERPKNLPSKFALFAKKVCFICQKSLLYCKSKPFNLFKRT